MALKKLENPFLSGVNLMSRQDYWIRKNNSTKNVIRQAIPLVEKKTSLTRLSNVIFDDLDKL